MEFLFLNHSASVEAIIVFCSLIAIALLFSHDAYHWIRRKYISLNPRKAYTLESGTTLEEIVPVVEESGTWLIQKESVVNMTFDTLSETDVTGDSGVTESVELASSSSEDETAVTETITTLVSAPQAILPEGEASEIEAPSEASTEELLVDASEDINTASSPEQPKMADEVVTPPEEVAPVEIWIEPESVLDWIPESTLESSSEITAVPVDAASEEASRADAPEMIPEKEKWEEKPQASTPKDSLPPPDKREELVEIVNNVKTLIARGHLDEAKALLITGLAIQKNHRELNLIMASLYERDHAFEKAEFILKDIALTYPDDVEILAHLATVLAMQRKYEVAYELYKKILSLGSENEETLYTLTHLASELGKTEDMHLYAKSYLKQYPKNPEILWLYSQAQIAKSERKWAVETLIKLKNLTPYNQEIVDLIGKLVTEEELAGNFGEEK